MKIIKNCSVCFKVFEVENKEEVICENCKLVKIRKSKKGRI